MPEGLPKHGEPGCPPAASNYGQVTIVVTIGSDLVSSVRVSHKTPASGWREKDLVRAYRLLATRMPTSEADALGIVADLVDVLLHATD